MTSTLKKLGALTQMACEQIGRNIQRAGGLLRFDPITIITIIGTLLPILMGLCKKDDPVEQQKAAIASFNQKTGRYKAPALRAAIRRAYWAAKENGQKLTREEAEVVAIMSLDQVRTANPITFTAVWREMSANKHVQSLNTTFDATA